MHTTPPSLLAQLRQSAQEEAWARFVKLYTPLLFYWARRLGLHDADAADLVQEVFTVLVQKLPAFQYDQRKGFRNWLLTITLNKWRDRLRRSASVQVGEQGLADVPAPPDPDAFGEGEYRQHLVNRALELMQTDFEPSTWKACWEHTACGRPAVEVAADLGISVNAVYIAKSRVLRRLHQELAGLMD